MSQVAILARVTAREGRAGQYLAALAPLLEQARKEPGTLLYAVHRSADDPEVFWTTEVYADNAAFAAHRATEVHAAAEPVLTELIAVADVTLCALNLLRLHAYWTGTPLDRRRTSHLARLELGLAV